MRTTELKKFILLRFGREKFYGYEIHKTLGADGIKIGVGRLYSILGEMLKEGILSETWIESSQGPNRKEYELTSAGLQTRISILQEAIDLVHKFYLEYLLGLPEKSSVFVKVSKVLQRNVKRMRSIAFVSSKISTPVKQLVSEIHSVNPDVTPYFVGCKLHDLETIPEYWKIVDGGLSDIPFKDDFLDLIISIGYQDPKLLLNSVHECRRVLGRSGALAIIIPSVLIQNYDDPLTIGMFIEKFEHQTLDEQNKIHKESYTRKLGLTFKKIREERIVHLTVLLASGQKDSR